MPRVTVVDYGVGNLRSVAKALEHVGGAVEVTSDPARVAAAGRLVLPGVGAFAAAMAGLTRLGLLEPVRDAAISAASGGRPFLGICLGLQVLMERSLEDGKHEGLGVCAGDVVGFDAAALRPLGLKVPHMGWTPIRVMAPACPPLAGVGDEAHVYFVHSYRARPADPSWVAATADHGGPFAAALWRGRLFATQFHPEKSQAVGLAILERWMRS